MNNKRRETQHRKDARLCVSNIARATIAAITICIAFTYAGLSAQSKGFNDTVILKNGTVLTGVKAVVTKDSLVVTTSEGETSVFTKKEVSEVKKGGGGNGENTTKPETKTNPSSGNWSGYQGTLKWEDGKRKCANLKMRLPTKDELVAAYTSGLYEKWQKEKSVKFTWYWTSEESGNSAYYVSMVDGFIGSTFKGDSDYIIVRCIR
jgi:hypothetical protein